MGLFGLFGKPKMHEEDAAAQFIMTMLRVVRENWVQLTAPLRDFVVDTKHFDSSWGQLELGFAFVGTQFQAVWNLLPADQAQRLRDHVVKILNLPDGGDRAVESFEAYDATWRRARNSKRNPFEMLSVTLCDRLDIHPPLVLGSLPSLFVLDVGQIMLAFPGWWKNLLEKYRLIP